MRDEVDLLQRALETHWLHLFEYEIFAIIVSSGYITWQLEGRMTIV